MDDRQYLHRSVSRMSGLRKSTYVLACVSSDVSRVGRFWYSSGMGICHRHLSAGWRCSWLSRSYRWAWLVGDLEHLVRFLSDLENQQHGYELGLFQHHRSYQVFVLHQTMEVGDYLPAGHNCFQMSPSPT